MELEDLPIESEYDKDFMNLLEKEPEVKKLVTTGDLCLRTVTKPMMEKNYDSLVSCLQYANNASYFHDEAIRKTSQEDIKMYCINRMRLTEEIKALIMPHLLRGPGASL
ncbi:MAG: hypothetical protein IB618_02250 [Candidatus Pacearchaeota archaeon]|nr:MAG: hypothetical protein IB618_02250 [Candidatus Pacearchaeota archaeon]